MNSDGFTKSRTSSGMREASWKQFSKARVGTKSRAKSRKRGRISDSLLIELGSRIDLATIRGWLRECQSYHGGCCNERHTEALEQHLEKLILIDVELQCLVEHPSSTPYVALSYVWGLTPMIKTRRSNFESLQQPGALGQEINDIQLPQTIRDAMYLVKTLGQKHLWVDCLSLFQDETPERMNKSLQAMAYIYASADFTIVAAGGADANSGLPGIGGLSNERTLTAAGQQNDEFYGKDGYPWGSVWAQRGWTFQESLFSRRILVFGNSVSWACGRCVWLEEYNKPPLDRPSEWPSERPHLGLPVGLMSLIPRYPSLGRWGMLVERYSTRVLTYENDWKRAFAGATDVMDATFPGGLLHGLPVFFFDIALLWRPRTSILRRAEHPSWSWDGWRGAVNCLEPWYLFYPGVYRKSSEGSDWVPLATLKSVAKYQISERRESHDVHVRGLNAFYEYQDLREDPDALLPVGWDRIPHSEGTFYTHTSVSGPGFRYSYPLPTAHGVSRTKATDDRSVLICTAPICKLERGRFVELSLLEPTLLMLEAEGVDVGMIAVDHTPNDASLENGPESCCTLVAISEAVISDHRKIDEYSRYLLTGHPAPSENWKCVGGTPKDSEAVYFYNVLWIEWKDDVAYRKGVGAIQKEAWDSLAPEVMTFKLG